MARQHTDQSRQTQLIRVEFKSNGSAIFACSSGEHGTLRLSADGPYVGTGTGSSSFGPVRVLFGYSLAEVNRRIIPHGKRLVVTAEGTSLVDAQ